jgi:hypothetical protein
MEETATLARGTGLDLEVREASSVTIGASRIENVISLLFYFSLFSFSF